MRRNLEIFSNLFFWAISTWVIFQVIGLDWEEVEIILEDGREIITEQNTNLSGFFYYGLFLKILMFYLIVFYFVPKWTLSKRYGRFIAILAGMVLLFIFIELVPLWLMHGALDLDYFISALGLYGFYTAVAVAYGIIRNQLQTEQIAQKLANEKLQTELKLLRSQINPHFLFNALNNLLAISEASQNNAVSTGITQLSELLRFLIYDAQTDFVPLHKEIEFIESYMALQGLRYGEEEDIDIEWNAIGIQNNHLIAPALLIPFIENAFKHGVKYNVPSFIKISIEVVEGQLDFRIENSKHQIEKTEFDKKYSGIGLENVKKRLALMYKNKYNLDIQDLDKIFKVRLKIER